MGYLAINGRASVSLDFVNTKFSAVVDKRWTSIHGKDLLKLVLWYDNEAGYSSRVIDQIKFVDTILKIKRNNMKTVAVIPVKKVSERFESKNFRNIHEGKSLFELLIDKLIDSKSFDEIYVSSNLHSLKDTLSEKGVNFISRPDEFCNNDVPWSDVIAHVAQSIPEDDNSNIAWCHTTSPTFNRYKEAVSKYLKQKKELKNDGLITVTKSSDFIISEKLQPLNYSWGPWHQYSQFLEKFFYITGALFITTKQNMLKNRYVISRNPFLFEVNNYESIDIDSEYDFELAKILLENKKIDKK